MTEVLPRCWRRRWKIFRKTDGRVGSVGFLPTETLPRGPRGSASDQELGFPRFYGFPGPAMTFVAAPGWTTEASAAGPPRRAIGSYVATWVSGLVESDATSENPNRRRSHESYPRQAHL